MSKTKVLSYLFAAASTLASVQNIQAVDITVINFDNGFTGAENYSAATNKDTGIVGKVPEKFTKLDNGGTVSQWTATVASGNKFTGHFLRFDIEKGAKLSGRIEAFAPDSAGATSSGKVHVSFDYARLTPGGGPLMFIRPLGNYGEFMVNEVFYFDAYVGKDKTVKFEESQIYKIDITVDLDARTYSVTVDGDQVSHGEFKPLNGSLFSGFCMEFLDRSEDIQRSFGIDNLVAGAVVAP